MINLNKPGTTTMHIGEFLRRREAPFNDMLEQFTRQALEQGLDFATPDELAKFSKGGSLREQMVEFNANCDELLQALSEADAIFSHYGHEPATLCAQSLASPQFEGEIGERDAADYIASLEALKKNLRSGFACCPAGSAMCSALLRAVRGALTSPLLQSVPLALEAELEKLCLDLHGAANPSPIGRGRRCCGI